MNSRFSVSVNLKWQRNTFVTTSSYLTAQASITARASLADRAEDTQIEDPFTNNITKSPIFPASDSPLELRCPLLATKYSKSGCTTTTLPAYSQGFSFFFLHLRLQNPSLPSCKGNQWVPSAHPLCPSLLLGPLSSEKSQGTGTSGWDAGNEGSTWLQQPDTQLGELEPVHSAGQWLLTPYLLQTKHMNDWFWSYKSG